MMHNTIILLFVLAYANAFSINNGEDLSKKCWTDGNGEKSARYWDNGSEMTRGRYYYKCVDGRLNPVGCIKENGERVLKGDTYIEEGFEYRCVMDTEGYLFFEPVSCVVDEKRHQPGDTWDHPAGNAYWFTCEREYFYNRPYLSVKTQGCLVGRNRYRIKINETWDDEETSSWYKCLDRYDSTQLCLMGCIYNGEHKSGNDKWEEGEYVYTCAKKSDRAIIECIGCMNQGRQLRSGDRYLQNDQVYQCEILFNEQNNKLSADHRLIGCVERDRRGVMVAERTLGCRWVEQQGNIKYESTCTDEGRTMPVGCIMEKDGKDYLWIPGNMYTIHHATTGETIYLACRVEPNGFLNSFTFSEADLENGPSGRLRGLKYSPPRG